MLLNSKQKHRLSSSALILIAFGLGVLITIVLTVLSVTGLSGAWQALPAAPESIQSIADSYESRVYVRTLSGQLLLCYQERGQCWETVDAVNTQQIYPVSYQGECIASSLKMQRLPTQEVLQCHETRYQYPDGSGEYAFLLDSQGRVWKYERLQSAYNLAIVLILNACFSIPISVVIGAMVVGIRHLYQSLRVSPFLALLKSCNVQVGQ